jgi:CDP-glycerol:poly(glycerophosphate) glycerophosphotransferase
MSALVVRGRGGAASSPAEGARAVQWEDYLASHEADAVDEAAMAWTKAFGTRAVRDGRCVRDLLRWNGVSLWWFAELYLFHSTDAPRWVRTIEAFHRILDAERPSEVEADGLPAEEALLLERTCAARGVLFHGRLHPPARLSLRTRLVSLRARWNDLKTFLTALKATLAGAPALPHDAAKRPVLFLSHAAFWRRRKGGESEEDAAYEHYFDALIPGVAAHPGLRPVVLAVGPPEAFRRRGPRDRLRDWMRLRPEAGPYLAVNRFTTFAVARETRRASALAREAWRALRGSAGIREAFSHRGVAFDDLAAPDLAATLLLQLPWAVRSYEEVAAALRALRPAALVLYAESSGWGRAALLACRAAGVPTVAVQHGIIYPKYFSYRHGPGEEESPRPDRTAVFGEAAQRLLVQMGGYDPASLVVTGSPKFDALLASAAGRDRQRARARWGAADGDRLLIVASRYRGIRSTHSAIGPAFSALVRAVETTEGVVAVVKPHPAEPAEAYHGDLRGARRVRVAAPGDDLIELLHAADALVTVESLSAVEALVLGRPVLILQMPTNLRALVDDGAALGVPAGADPADALRRLLFDPATRQALEAARRRYLSEVAAGVDGGATRRILALIAETAGVSAAGGGDRSALGGVVG